MLPMTDSIRKKIIDYKKSKRDISELIKDVNIKGEDLSYCIIKYLNRTNCDLRGVNFSHCKIGSNDKIVSLIQCDLSGSNFNHCYFVGTTFMRSCKVHLCNFKASDVAKVSYEHSDFGEEDSQASNFCGAKITIGTNQGMGAKFPKQLFKDLMNGWGTNYKIVPGE